MGEFVGDDRHHLVDQALADWESCKLDRVSRSLVLEGHPGASKTRIVQEFFARLSAEQPPQRRFWPERLEPESEKLLAGRHWIVPAVPIKWGPRVKPVFAWIAIRCEHDPVSDEPVRAVIEAVERTDVINEPLVRPLDAATES